MKEITRDELLPWQKELIDTIKDSEKGRFTKILIQARCGGKLQKRTSEMLRKNMESVGKESTEYDHQVYGKGESYIDGVMFGFDEFGEIDEIGIPEEFLDEDCYG